jgi:hypothetical protein
MPPFIGAYTPVTAEAIIERQPTLDRTSWLVVWDDDETWARRIAAAIQILASLDHAQRLPATSVLAGRFCRRRSTTTTAAAWCLPVAETALSNAGV